MLVVGSWQFAVGGSQKRLQTTNYQPRTDMKAATVCPLDCPDACTLEVTVEDGRIASIDGTHVNPVTEGYICAKVRRFPERVYGPDRLMYPAMRKGAKGFASFERVSWEEALAAIAERMLETRREF